MKGGGRKRVGLFDSGVGGISVLKEVRSAFPEVDLLYAADQAYCPYGDRGADEIVERAVFLTEFLTSQDVDAVVVACNTATVVAIEVLRAQHAIPFIGTEPPVKPAAALSESGTVGVLATSRTLDGEKFERLLESHANGIRVLIQPCRGLADCVEAGDLDGPRTRSLVKRYVEPVVAGGADVIALGSTHYVFLRPLIAELAGSGVRIVDPVGGVVRRLAEVLGEVDPSAFDAPTGSVLWWTTSSTADSAPFGRLSGETANLQILR